MLRQSSVMPRRSPEGAISHLLPLTFCCIKSQTTDWVISSDAMQSRLMGERVWIIIFLALLRENLTSESLRYGTRCPRISQFYLHTHAFICELNELKDNREPASLTRWLLKHYWAERLGLGSESGLGLGIHRTLALRIPCLLKSWHFTFFSECDKSRSRTIGTASWRRLICASYLHNGFRTVHYQNVSEIQ